MRQVTDVCSGCIKNWSCMQGKSHQASGHRRKVPYEKLNRTRDGARARLRLLLSFSTAPPCACSRKGTRSPASWGEWVPASALPRRCLPVIYICKGWFECVCACGTAVLSRLRFLAGFWLPWNSTGSWTCCDQERHCFAPRTEGTKEAISQSLKEEPRVHQQVSVCVWCCPFVMCQKRCWCAALTLQTLHLTDMEQLCFCSRHQMRTNAPND